MGRGSSATSLRQTPTTRIPGPKELLKNVQNFKELDRATRSLLVFGWGDGGGGPSIEMLEKARRAKDFDGLPKLEQEKAVKFFAKAKADAKDLPVWVGELYLELHRATYTSQAEEQTRKPKVRIPAARRRTFRCGYARPGARTGQKAQRTRIALVYDVTGLGETDSKTHRAALDRAWKLVLLNQFHDIIPGSSIHWVYQDSARDYETVRRLGESVRDSALSTLTALIDTSAFKEPVLIANSLSVRRREIVELPGGALASVDVPPLGYLIIEPTDDFSAPRTIP